MGTEEDQQATDNGQAETGGHPAWQEILQHIPTDLQPLVTPVLKKWDDGVTSRINEIKSEYEPYKQYEDLVSQEIPPEVITQSLGLLQQFQEDPNKVVADAIDVFGLDYVIKAAEQAANEPAANDPDDPYAEIDLTKHPEFVQMKQALESFTTEQEKNKQEQEKEAQVSAFEKSLDDLQSAHETDGEFNRLFVSALMAQGVDGEEAVQQYYTTVNQAASKIAGVKEVPTPPVVLGGDSGTGSGIPQQPVKLGEMKKTDVNNLVTQYIENAKRAASQQS